MNVSQTHCSNILEDKISDRRALTVKLPPLFFSLQNVVDLDYSRQNPPKQEGQAIAESNAADTWVLQEYLIDIFLLTIFIRWVIES